MPKLLILGLDGAPPELLYGDLGGELENLESVMEVRGVLRSSHPPITIPAWMVLSTGKTPGELGLYGFRHRRRGSYQEVYIASSRSVRARRLWDHVSELGGRSIVIGVPPSYPPYPIRGLMVSCFITPGPDKPYTWPPQLRARVESLLGGPYIFDSVYRSREKDKIRRGLWRLTTSQFKVVRHLLASEKWDLAFYVLIGTDRAHHAFWKYYDPGHPKYPGPGNEFEDVIPRYYKLVDREFGELLKKLPGDVRVMIVSDHGAMRMEGALAVNQVLEEMGYLRLRKRPEGPGEDLREDMVDWDKTIAWAWGGYYSRVYVNLKYREPRGVVEPGEYDDVVEQLRRDLARVRGPRGEALENRVYRPSELYPEVRGDAPDLIYYIDDLRWRAAGTIGWPSPYLEENDRGPDDAVHSWTGVIAFSDGGARDFVRGTVSIERVKEWLVEYIKSEGLAPRNEENP